MNWALVWWKLTSSGGGDADDGVDSALGEPGSGGEFSVHRGWEPENGPDAITCTSTRYASIQIQSSLFSSSSPQPSLILNLKYKLRRLELNRMNLVFINSFRVDILSI